jgi:hypothetical protein
MRIANAGRRIRDIAGADWLGADTATGATFTSLRKFCTTTATGARPPGKSGASGNFDPHVPPPVLG